MPASRAAAPAAHPRTPSRHLPPTARGVTPPPRCLSRVVGRPASAAATRPAPAHDPRTPPRNHPHAAPARRSRQRRASALHPSTRGASHTAARPPGPTVAEPARTALPRVPTYAGQAWAALIIQPRPRADCQPRSDCVVRSVRQAHGPPSVVRLARVAAGAPRQPTPLQPFILRINGAQQSITHAFYILAQRRLCSRARRRAGAGGSKAARRRQPARAARGAAPRSMTRAPTLPKRSGTGAGRSRDAAAAAWPLGKQRRSARGVTRKPRVRAGL